MLPPNVAILQKASRRPTELNTPGAHILKTLENDFDG